MKGRRMDLQYPTDGDISDVVGVRRNDAARKSDAAAITCDFIVDWGDAFFRWMHKPT
jgi:hypothetical protein